jgi:hypothetical protein
MKMQRWTTRPRADGTTDAEGRAGLLLRRAVVKQPLNAGTLDDIQSRLPEGHRVPPGRLLLRFGVAFALFLSGGGVVMSATLLRRWSLRPPASSPVALSSPASPRRHAATAAPRGEISAEPTLIAESTLIAEPTPVAALALPALARRAREARPADVEPPAPVPPDVTPSAAAPAPTPSAIAEEAALVGAALRKVREHDDAAGALALLDERDVRFGAAGTLADEARTTRVEALLRLGQHARALALLDSAAPRPSGRGRALLVTRGELRADAGRCRGADADFDALLADDATSDDTTERALYGRSACRARLGESDGARADLEAYLTRFPGGRFADRARAALDP